MASPLPLRWQAFRLSKQGNSADEYEDASAGDLRSGRFAIADGASEASFAGLWATLLADQFVADPGKPWRDLDWVVALRSQWLAQVENLPLPWYAEEKRALGAFATFLGLVFRQSKTDKHGYWRALAVGDCCLFHTHGKALVRAFPLIRSADFGNQPSLLRSRGSTELPLACEQAKGRWEPNDCFLLMTDALAQWFLLRNEQGQEPLMEIHSLLREQFPEKALADWIAERRRQSILRNDDVTLIVVNVD
jgi:Protein phosphatase 2C